MKCECCENGIHKVHNDIQKKIDAGHHSIIGVMTNPPFTYSIGLHVQGFPEIIITGMPNQLAGFLINKYAKLLKVNGPIEPGTFVHGVSNMGLCVVACDDQIKQEYLIQARSHYGHWNFTAHQLAFPDEDYNYPWQAEYDKRMVQPILGIVQ